MQGFPPLLPQQKRKGLITTLGKQGFVDFIHPCFTSAYGKDMAYGDELVVKLKTSTSAGASTIYLSSHPAVL